MLSTADYTIQRFESVDKIIDTNKHGVKRIGALLEGGVKNTYFILFPNDEFFFLLPGGSHIEHDFFPVREREILVRYFRSVK